MGALWGERPLIDANNCSVCHSLLSTLQAAEIQSLRLLGDGADVVSTSTSQYKQSLVKNFLQE